MSKEFIDNIIYEGRQPGCMNGGRVLRASDEKRAVEMHVPHIFHTVNYELKYRPGVIIKRMFYNSI